MESELGRLRLYLFGLFRLEREKHEIAFPARKVESLLAYLALHPEAHSRDTLATLMWGDSDTKEARHSLRTALSTLNRLFGDHALIADRTAVRINPNAALWVDVHEFDALTRQPGEPDDLERAIKLYRDDLLVDFHDEWIQAIRERYLQRYVAALLHLAQAMRARSEYDRAIEYAAMALARDALNEQAHHQLMFCHVALGNRPAAQRQYDKLVQMLRDEFNLEPSAETRALYDWIRHAPAQREAREAQITNLPIPLTSFIGRKRETAEVKRLLTSSSPSLSGAGLGVSGPSMGQRSSPRLITLTGAGGSGKTRLAIQAATDLIDYFKDGVWWVELAPVVSEAFVPQAVAKALGVQEASDQALTDTITNHLCDKHALLILDNCEHVLAVCGRLAQTLLQACPDLRILVTSREPLGMLGEVTWPVPTLSLPDSHKLSLVQALLEYEGFRLFIERAQAVNAGFALTDDQALAIAQICRRLDGIPLAIELAAARVRSMSVDRIAANLNDRFNLLTGGNRSALPRHQTLRATIDWSYALLSEPERILFRQLSVLVGGWTLEAAEAVASELGMPNAELRKGDAPSFHTSHSRLVDKSLVLAEQHYGDMRYRMLETIREYAAEKLVGSGEQVRIRDIHLDFFT
jgi:predicted ATPase/DNA-binding SARP family transcriptional activator